MTAENSPGSPGGRLREPKGKGKAIDVDPQLCRHCKGYVDKPPPFSDIYDDPAPPFLHKVPFIKTDRSHIDRSVPRCRRCDVEITRNSTLVTYERLGAWQNPIQEHNRAILSMKKTVETLRNKCPADLQNADPNNAATRKVVAEFLDHEKELADLLTNHNELVEKSKSALRSMWAPYWTIWGFGQNADIRPDDWAFMSDDWMCDGGQSCKGTADADQPAPQIMNRQYELEHQAQQAQSPGQSSRQRLGKRPLMRETLTTIMEELVSNQEEHLEQRGLFFRTKKRDIQRSMTAEEQKSEGEGEGSGKGNGKREGKGKGKGKGKEN